MPDAVEAAGQDVDQEAADELGGGGMRKKFTTVHGDSDGWSAQLKPTQLLFLYDFLQVAK